MVQFLLMLQFSVLGRGGIFVAQAVESLSGSNKANSDSVEHKRC